jgi:hypothetical protein
MNRALFYQVGDLALSLDLTATSDLTYKATIKTSMWLSCAWKNKLSHSFLVCLIVMGFFFSIRRLWFQFSSGQQALFQDLFYICWFSGVNMKKARFLSFHLLVWLIFMRYLLANRNCVSLVKPNRRSYCPRGICSREMIIGWVAMINV